MSTWSDCDAVAHDSPTTNVIWRIWDGEIRFLLTSQLCWLAYIYLAVACIWLWLVSGCGLYLAVASILQAADHVIGVCKLLTSGLIAVIELGWSLWVYISCTRTVQCISITNSSRYNYYYFLCDILRLLILTRDLFVFHYILFTRFFAKSFLTVEGQTIYSFYLKSNFCPIKSGLMMICFPIILADEWWLGCLRNKRIKKNILTRVDAAI